MIRRAVIVILTLAAVGTCMLDLLSGSVQPTGRLYSAIGGDKACWVEFTVKDHALHYYHPGRWGEPHSIGPSLVATVMQSWVRFAPFVKSSVLIPFVSHHVYWQIEVPLWMPSLAFATYPAFVFLMRSRRRRSYRRRHGLCIECGYNLTGLPEPRCPECGREFDREGRRV